MRVFRTLGEAMDMPGLRAVGTLLAARTAQMLTAATRYVEDELEAGRHPGSVTIMSIKDLLFMVASSSALPTHNMPATRAKASFIAYVINPLP